MSVRFWKNTNRQILGFKFHSPSSDLSWYFLRESTGTQVPGKFGSFILYVVVNGVHKKSSHRDSSSLFAGAAWALSQSLSVPQWVRTICMHTSRKDTANETETDYNGDYNVIIGTSDVIYRHFFPASITLEIVSPLMPTFLWVLTANILALWLTKRKEKRKISSFVFNYRLNSERFPNNERSIVRVLFRKSGDNWIGFSADNAI